MKVEEIMTRSPAIVAPDSTVGEAATLMKQEDCGSLPVVEGTKLVGIVTDRDIVIRGVAAGKDVKTLKVSEIMSADPVVVSPDTTVDEARKVMADRQIRRLPVVADGSLVGIVVTAQIARQEDHRETGETISEISAPSSGKGSRGRG